MKPSPATPRARSSKPAPATTSARPDPVVIAFLHDLDHPLRAEFATVRQLILDADPRIHEGIKWNAPSFCTGEFFATFNLRPRDRLRVIFHLGAKARDTPADGLQVADPTGLLEWLAKDRAMVTLRDAADVAARAAALQDLVRAWIRLL